MGILIVDHSGTEGPDGKPGRKVELDTVSCCHCQAVIRLVIKGVQKAYETKHRCDRCKAPICKWCAEHNIGCTPVAHKIERAVKTGQWLPNEPYEFKILPHR